MKQNEKMLGKIREYPAEFDYLTDYQIGEDFTIFTIYLKAMQLFMQCL